MKLRIEIEIDASETIVDAVKRGNFNVNKDGSGHKLVVGNEIVVPSRKCSIKFSAKKEIVNESEYEPTEISVSYCT